MRDTIDMAREAGIDAWWDSGSDWRETFNEHLTAFEALVRADERNRTWTQEHWTEYELSIAAAEREACAKAADERGWHGTAKAIRARGNT